MVASKKPSCPSSYFLIASWKKDQSFSFTCKPSIYGKDLQHWPGAMGWTGGQGFFVKDEVGICQRFLFSEVEVSFEVESHQD